jgi:hypothetical protein
MRLPGQAFKLWRWLLTVCTIIKMGRRADVLYVNELYLEAMLADCWLRKPVVQKIVGDWAWERATNKRWVTDSFEEFQRNKYGLQVGALKALRTLWVRHAGRVIVPSPTWLAVLPARVSQRRISALSIMPSNRRKLLALYYRLPFMSLSPVSVWQWTL